MEYPITFCQDHWDKLRDEIKKQGLYGFVAKDGELLQLLGTEWGRNCVGKNIWVDCLKGELEHLKKIWTEKHHLFCIVGDCRFENEFDSFPDALRVRLYCDKETRKKRCSDWREKDAHLSEIGLDKYAGQGKFDLCLHTKYMDISECAEQILRALTENTWKEFRD